MSDGEDVRISPLLQLSSPPPKPLFSGGGVR